MTAGATDGTFAPGARPADHVLDITGEVCPFTFVRTKLLLERMAPGEVVEVRLNAGEPLANVPRAAAAQGHRVLGTAPAEGGTHRLWIQKG